MLELCEQISTALSTSNTPITIKRIAAKTGLQRKQVKAALRIMDRISMVKKTLRTPECSKKRPVYANL